MTVDMLGSVQTILAGLSTDLARGQVQWRRCAAVVLGVHIGVGGPAAQTDAALQAPRRRGSIPADFRRPAGLHGPEVFAWRLLMTSVALLNHTLPSAFKLKAVQWDITNTGDMRRGEDVAGVGASGRGR